MNIHETAITVLKITMAFGLLVAVYVLIETEYLKYKRHKKNRSRIKRF